MAIIQSVVVVEDYPQSRAAMVGAFSFIMRGFLESPCVG
jgi:hypothetical protein